jgi:hypothetical protein
MTELRSTSLKKKVLVIFDTQISPDNLRLNAPLLRGIGRLIVRERPTHIVHIGDHFDMTSLGMHDMAKKNKLVFDGGDLRRDIEAGRDGLFLIIQDLRKLQLRQALNRKKVYRPELHFTIGNHEERITRFPELRGLVTYEDMFMDTGFTVHDFLKPVEIGGVHFVHYAYNALSGRPIGGTAEFRLNKLKMSFVQGHEQTFKYAQEYLNDGRKISALICGSCYLHDEKYKGYQGNNHFRGAAMLHDVKDGMYDLEQYSVGRIINE